MRKLTFMAFAAALLCGAAASASTEKGLITDLGESKYGVSVGDISMTIDAKNGARILSFKRGETEIISQLPMREQFGSTFWTSPQKEWNWPPVNEYDKASYQVEQTPTSLIMTGQKSKRYGYSIRKEFSTDAKHECIVVKYSIVNESDEVRKVAPWEITRVKNEGYIFFDADSVTPSNLMQFTPQYGALWYETDAQRSNRKINADGSGWLAYCGQGLVLVKKFQDIKADEPAPAEAEVQVYVNSGKTYIELESQGAYTTLQPGESLDYTVRWYLVPAKDPQLPSKKLLKQVKKLIR